jgi:hypothetical protein
MFHFLGLCFQTLVRLLRSRQRLLENMVRRQQLVVLKRRHRRPRLDRFDRLFWLLVRRCWSGWKEALLVVTPETAVRWHRAGFRWYWTVISKPRKPIARRRTSQEVRDLNFQMVAENPTWGARREILTESLLVGGVTVVQLVFRVQTFAKGNCAMLRRCVDEILAKNTGATIVFESYRVSFGAF